MIIERSDKTHKVKVFLAVVLIFMLTVNTMPVSAVSTPFHSHSNAAIQTTPMTNTPTLTSSPAFTPTNVPTLANTPTFTTTTTSTAPVASTVTGTSTATAEGTGIATNTTTATGTATVTSNSGNTLMFTMNADARVSEASPATNYGTSKSLRVDGGAGVRQTSYIRFSVSGINGSVQSVRLRVFCTTNSTANGPAVYLADSNWIESGTGGITWNNQPALLSGVLDNAGAIRTKAWVEYDVTSQVTADSTYTFALVADSNDGVTFSSREGTAPPRLIITLGTGAPTATAIPSQTATSTSTPSTSTPSTSTPSTSTPVSTSAGDVTLVGAGDISTCSNNNDEATAKLLDTIPGTVFTAGDNAYDSGSYTQYINCYDPTWGRHKSRTEPVPGNHEYVTSGATGYFQYFNNFSEFYAYNLGAWRIYALNSEIDTSATSSQAIWLQSDLALNPTQCVLAYWHKARWSSGSTHGSTSSMQAIWQILYDAGAELVVNGHEHNYERFAEMNASGSAASPGMREIVAGTGGVGLYGFGTPLTTSQVRNSSTFGVLKLTLHAGSYDWQFVPIAGSTFSDSGSSNCH